MPQTQGKRKRPKDEKGESIPQALYTAQLHRTAYFMQTTESEETIFSRFEEVKQMIK